MPNLVPLPSQELAVLAPNWAAMTAAIVRCENLDEIRLISDQTMAMRAYFSQAQDTANEIKAMRLRLRAERRLGELIKAEQTAGRLAKIGDFNGNQHSGMSSSATHLADLDIPRDRSSRAQKLAEVPADQFEAALHNGRPSARSIVALAPSVKAKPPPIDIEPVLKTWGTLRDFAAALDDGSMLSAVDWRGHPGIQPFQIAEILEAIPRIVRYLTALEKA